jgi:secreted PhoX family phosphatase
VHQHIYLTEDKPDGLLYRFTPDAYPDLTSGFLEVAEILDPKGEGPIQPGQARPLAWLPLINVSPPGGGIESAIHLPAGDRATRYQAEGATTFSRGEGAWYEGGIFYFTTTGDNRVWALDTAAQTIEIIYDFATSDDPELFGADNVVASRAGDVYVAEDGGDMQIVALTAGGDVKPVVEIPGQPDSEVVGPALSPDGLRMYFSSQRGPTPNGDWGVTYEVSGPFAPYPTSAGDGSIGGKRLTLSSSPNPFASRTQITYTLVSGGWTRIRVHDVDGRLVRSLVDGPASAGRHVVSWDGRTDGRSLAASGFYFVRLETRGRSVSRKINFRH